jgi:hypothetical protein
MWFDEMLRLTQRLRFVKQTKRQFWAKWMQQVFGWRVLSHKWTKTVRDVSVGDMVLLAEAENDDPTYRMGVMEEVQSGKDGHVRTMNIRYTNPGKAPGEQSPPKSTMRPVHKILFILPADYMFEDGVERTKGDQSRPEPPVGATEDLGLKKVW